MYSFRNDYSELATKEVFELLNKVANEQHSGYGLDDHTLNAKKLICSMIGFDVDIHFIAGGTLVNQLVIAHSLKPYEAVICVETGHINVHETGAIEATGHKVVTVPGVEGKITPESIEEVVLKHIDEHMVKPRMVYISNATEIGTIYYKDELLKIREVCDKHQLLLFMDGARLGCALTAKGNDMNLQIISKLCDIFYIGGTKNGAMLGEAVVITNEVLKENFRFSIKHNGAMLSKGFLLGIQFEALFTDQLIFKLAAHANEMAQLLQNGLAEAGVELGCISPTNQQFAYFSKAQIEKMREEYDFEIWEYINDSRIMIRFVTSFSTSKKEVEKFLGYLKNIILKIKE